MKWLRRLLIAGLIGLSVRAVVRWIGARNDSGLDADQTKNLLAAIGAAYHSTVEALEASADGNARDARAASDAEALRAAVAAVTPTLSARLQPLASGLVDAVASAQVQIMAFAINRKNRGLPDAVQTKAEDTDRRAFVETAGPVYRRLVEALS
jgi:predicted component of type VI protein secretion system